MIGRFSGMMKFQDRKAPQTPGITIYLSAFQKSGAGEKLSSLGTGFDLPSEVKRVDAETGFAVPLSAVSKAPPGEKYTDLL
jgi:hypothetical protein